MKLFQIVLANLIRGGKVTVELPNIDLDKLRGATRHYYESLLEQIQGILYADDMTDGEKLAEIQTLVEQGEEF